jgi:VanZ family protein
MMRFPALGSASLRLVFGIAVAAVVILSLLPGEYLPQVRISDKLEHVIAYGCLMFAGALAFPSMRATLRLAVLLPLLGIALEFGQMLVPGRTAEVGDAVADTVGVVIVTLVLLFLVPESPRE